MNSMVAGNIYNIKEETSKAGTSYHTFSVMESIYTGKGEDGKSAYENRFVNCIMFGTHPLLKSLSKGQGVIVIGEQDQAYVDKEGKVQLKLKVSQILKSPQDKVSTEREVRETIQEDEDLPVMNPFS